MKLFEGRQRSQHIFPVESIGGYLLTSTLEGRKKTKTHIFNCHMASCESWQWLALKPSPSNLLSDTASWEEATQQTVAASLIRCPVVKGEGSKNRRRRLHHPSKWWPTSLILRSTTDWKCPPWVLEHGRCVSHFHLPISEQLREFWRRRF